ncbi:MAG: hypothetical protein JWM32_2094 [Verrucomicrobia bacterium]|nr:hypothetical protein [Verrucomicrobiota bacterium]
MDMKKIVQPNSGKILVHGKGSGVLTSDDLERRAAELADIAGHVEPGADERQQAARELEGGDLSDPTESDASSERAVTRDPSEPVSDLGHQTPDREADDEQKSIERLVTEGVEEAQHEQMIAAARRRHNP